MNQTLGDARVSTADQDADLQVDELTAAGCHRIFVEYASGARAERPKLAQALDHLRSGDTLVIGRLDRLARSLRDLIDVVTAPRATRRRLPQAPRADRHHQPGGRLVFHFFARWPSSNGTSSGSALWLGWQLPGLGGRNGGRPTVMTPAKIARARELYEQGVTSAWWKSPRPSA